MPSVVISGTGAYLPETTLTNDDLARRVDTSDEWIRTRTGIRERRIAGEKEPTSELAVHAGREAIENAGLTVGDIDLLIVGTLSPDMLFPCTAALVQTRLGCRPVACFDVEAACSGFIYLMDIATAMLQGGYYRHALIIGAEKITSILDWTDRSTCVLFGDGAGAAVLSRLDESNNGKPPRGVLSCLLGADGSNPSLLCQPGGGSTLPASPQTVESKLHTLKMNGREIFKVAVRVMEQSAREILRRHNLTTHDVDLLVPHQANMRILEALALRLEIPMGKVFVNLDKYGNTSAASIPIALHEARQAGRVQPGQTILFVAFGAGLTWAASIVRW